MTTHMSLSGRVLVRVVAGALAVAGGVAVWTLEMISRADEEVRIRRAEQGHRPPAGPPGPV